MKLCTKTLSHKKFMCDCETFIASFRRLHIAKWTTRGWQSSASIYISIQADDTTLEAVKQRCVEELSSQNSMLDGEYKRYTQ